MTESKKTRLSRLIPDGRLDRIRLALALLLSLLLTATAICLIVSCISIYKNGGEAPYSREIAALHLGRVAPISLITVALLMIAGALSLFSLPARVKSLPLSKKSMLAIYKRKLGRRELCADHTALVAKEKKTRRIILLCSAALSLIFAVAALIFILNPARYSLDDINTDIAYSVVIAAVSVVPIFALCFVASCLLDRSYSREIESVKTEIKNQTASGSVDKEDELLKNEGHTVLLVRAVILTVAVAFIIAGVINGGMADVLGKAVRICTECIGLG